MAKMIPPHCDDKAPSSERRIFDLFKNDPATADWIVLHSLNLARSGERPYGEVDFVVVVPAGGVFCIEVKGGRVACRDGIWTTTNAAGRTDTLKRSPFKQADDAMRAVRDALEKRLENPTDFQKVAFGCAVIFTNVVTPPLEPGVEPWEVIDCDGLETPISAHVVRMAKNQRARFHLRSSPAEPQPALLKQIREALRPDFERVIARSAELRESERRLLSLTEEQYRILDLLADNPRCLFEGAAGTGKTLLALEYARRCATAGQRVLLVCFNKLLGDWLAAELAAPVTNDRATAGRFYKCLREVIISSPAAAEFADAEQRASGDALFGEAYPFYGQLALEGTTEKYDVVVVDEAQDLVRKPVLDVLNAWLVGGLREGRWAFFGDFHRQALYGTKWHGDPCEMLRAMCPFVVRANLTQNCRNTRRIGEETALLSGFATPPYRMGQVEGVAVDYLEYYDAVSQRAALTKALTRLATEPGVDPGDVVLLSRHRVENSVAGTLSDVAEFRVRPVDRPASGITRVPVFIFATVQAFKGMESKIVVLCDVDEVETDESRSLLYVGMSRARSLLVVLLHKCTKAAVKEAFKKQMTELWGANV
jgi:hypothetical protein